MTIPFVTDFHLRSEGDIIPLGLSITQTEIAWYIRVRDLAGDIRVVRLPKLSAYIVAEHLITSELKKRPVDVENEKKMQDMMENNNDY